MSFHSATSSGSSAYSSSISHSSHILRQIPQRPQRKGQVFTFGSAVGGELGLGPHIHERRKPGMLKLLGSEIVAIECGGQHTLALNSKGEVFSWGVNDQGALGRNAVDALADSDSEDDAAAAAAGEINGDEAWAPIKVPLPSPVVQMVCADSFSTVLTDNGQVYAWGSFRDPSGVIGFNKTTKQSQHQPQLITAFKQPVVLLGAGENHILAITADDTLWAFGANDEAQLGRRVSSRLKNNLEPYEIVGRRHMGFIHKIVKISGGAFHTLYINLAGELFSFGCNNCGQLGDGTLLSKIAPERVAFGIDEQNQRIPLPPIIDIAAGESHSLAIANDGRVFSFGGNSEGQLGYETTRPLFGDERDLVPYTEHIKSSPSSSKNNSPAKPPPSQASNEQRDSYKLKFQSVPRAIPGFRAESVDAQSRFSVAISNGALYTWGSGHCYQLGNEEMEDETTPFQVELKGRTCFSAKCGGQFTMFLLDPKPSDTPNPMAVTNGNGSGGGNNPSNDNAMNGNGANNFGSASPAKPGFGADESSNTANMTNTYGNYRLHNEIIAPTSPIVRAPFSSPINPASLNRRQSTRLSSSPNKQKLVASLTEQQSDSRSNSPTQFLRQTFESVCVSPEKRGKRPITDSPGGSRIFSQEEKAAPWSPGKKLFDSPAASDSPAPKKFGRGMSLKQRIDQIKPATRSAKGGMMASSEQMDIDPHVAESAVIRRTSRRNRD